MIAAWEPCSFIDFPGKLSAVAFVRGCNLRCPYCHNSDLIRPGKHSVGDKDLSGAFLEFLKGRQGILSGVVISGGEPTLWAGLDGFLRRVRAMGFSIKLDTNGTRPEIVAALIAESLVDFIAMDLKDEPGEYEWLGLRSRANALGQTLSLLRQSGVEYEIRTTVVLPLHSEKKIRKMSIWLAKGERWYLQPYRKRTKTPDASNLGEPTREYLETVAQEVRETTGIDCVVR